MEQQTQQRIFLTWVKEIENKKNWTDNQWATAAGLSHSIFSKARSGILPRWDACAALADAADVPRDHAFRAAGLMKPDPTLSSAKELLIHWAKEMDDDTASDLAAMAEAAVRRKATRSGNIVKKK
jgi:hypothetical protein